MPNKSAPIPDDCTIFKKYIDNSDGTWSEAVDAAMGKYPMASRSPQAQITKEG